MVVVAAYLQTKGGVESRVYSVVLNENQKLRCEFMFTFNIDIGGC